VELVKEKVISWVPAAPDWPATAMRSPGSRHVRTTAGAVVVVVVETGEDVVDDETGEDVGAPPGCVVVVACRADELAEHAPSPSAMAIERPPAAVLSAGVMSTAYLLAARLGVRSAIPQPMRAPRRSPFAAPRSQLPVRSPFLLCRPER